MPKTERAVCRWGAGLQLCRARNEKLLWAILAALAVKAGQLEAATAAFASIDQVCRPLLLIPVLIDWAASTLLLPS